MPAVQSAHAAGLALRWTSRRCQQLARREARHALQPCASASSLPAGRGKASQAGQPPARASPGATETPSPASGATGAGALSPGSEVTVRCDSLAFGGSGVCRPTEGDNKAAVVMVPFALPGDTLVARIERSQGRYWEAEKVSLLSPAPARVAAPCSLFGSCGGCAYQELSYGAQLAWKQRQVADALSKFGGFRAALDGAEGGHGQAAAAGDGPAVPVRATLGSARQLRYRNKVEFTIGRGEGGAAVLGLLSKGASLGSDEAAGAGASGGFVPVAGCHLQHSEADAVLATVQKFLRENPRGVPPFDPQTGVGLLRRVMIRCAEAGPGASEESSVRIQVDLVSAFFDATSALGALAALLAERHPAVVSVVNTVDPADIHVRSGPSGKGAAGRGRAGPPPARRPGGGAAARPPKGGVVSAGSAGGFTRALHGPDRLPLRLLGLMFEVSPQSFFQVNTGQANELLRRVEAACALREGRQDVLLDLFCGTGAIGLCLASRAKELHGWEISPDAVRDARANAERNGVGNASFHCGDLKTAAAALGRRVPDPDVIVVDPARAGMAPALVGFLRRTRARRLVYVSCNPATMARDAKLLCAEAAAEGMAPFVLESVEPVDMFPQTAHIEAVAVFAREQLLGR